MGDSKLSKKEIKELQKDIDKLKKALKAIEKLGGKPPKWMLKSLKGLDMAVKAGKGIGDAAEQTSKDLKRFNQDLKVACKDLDLKMKMVCEAKVERTWLGRNTEWTLSYKNPKSVSSNSVDKIIKFLVPEAICKRLDRCAKIEKGK